MTATVLTGGTVLTCDANDSAAEAVTIDDGRVIAVGEREEVRAAAGPAARAVDLDGAVLLPGLIDTRTAQMRGTPQSSEIRPLGSPPVWP